MALKIHFTEEDWERVSNVWMRFWQGDLDRPIVIIENQKIPTNVLLPKLPPGHFSNPETMSMSADELLDRLEPHLETIHYYGDSYPAWAPDLGPVMIAAFLGAEVHWTPHTTWFSPKKEVAIKDLTLKYDPENIWWKRTKELTSLAASRWKGKIVIGHTDLGGNLDILASLRKTQNLLYELVDFPEEVSRLVKEITKLWIRYYDELYLIINKTGRGTSAWAPVWLPNGKMYMLQSDFSYMISPQMFEKFVLPDIEECTEFLDYSFYHLDGKGQIPHLDLLLSLPRLDGIQWVPGDGMPPPEKWIPLLKRIRNSGKLCQLFITPEGAKTVVNELGGKGFILHIRHDNPISEEDAKNLIHTLCGKSIKSL